MFSSADALPKGAFTVSFKFHLFARRQRKAICSLGIRYANLLSFGTTPGGDALYFDIDNEALDLPAPGGYSSGWHQVTVSFDSATGVLQAYFDGQLGLNKTGFKQGKSLAGTFGPGLRPATSSLPSNEGVSLGRHFLMHPKQVVSSLSWFRRMPSLRLMTSTP